MNSIKNSLAEALNYIETDTYSAKKNYLHEKKDKKLKFKRTQNQYIFYK